MREDVLDVQRGAELCRAGRAGELVAASAAASASALCRGTVGGRRGHKARCRRRGEAASATLSRVRSDELRSWYVKHGHASGRLRYRLAGRPGRGVAEAVRVPPASPASLVSAVFARDSYSCRYCGLRLFPRRVLVAFGRIVGTEQFEMGGTNALRHGAVVGFQAVADHVLPWNLGGRTEMDNLVTACWCCNFGKAGYTLEQLGLDDPRDREPVRSDWDGLVGLLPALRLAGRKERRTG